LNSERKHCATGADRNGSYENNWPFARSYLCRKFVKGIVNSQAILEDTQENTALMKFQMFLNSSDQPDQLRELDFAYFGLGSTSGASMLTGKGGL
jgi:hypothetical protein